MLGIIKPRPPSWNWAAYGKHPAARDFFRVGEDIPLLKGFLNWVEEGYNSLRKNENDNVLPNSWRFWAKGAARETIICGLIRDSSDSIGRNYPFLVIGTGYLKDWEEQWDLIPLACEKTWNQMEYISAQKFSDLRKLETEIDNIRPPDPAWPEFKVKLDEAVCRNQGELSNRISDVLSREEGFIPLAEDGGSDQSVLISSWHHLLRKKTGTIPNSTFMGGTYEKVLFAFFRRPLTAGDFVKLWTAPGQRITITEHGIFE